LVIAIDGPSGAGKGTVARALAGTLGYRHVDTGAMYRAVAWRASMQAIDLDDAEAVARVAREAVFDLTGGVAVDGHDVTGVIRTPEIDSAAAIVARHAAVRAVLVGRQRQYGAAGGLVMEGRDIGTVVFPSADIKIFLDASPDERARRRSADTDHAAGRPEVKVDTVARALAARDASDRNRAISPLARADDAIYIDTTDMPVDRVVETALALVKKAFEASNS
jgi:cytidylate kinase